LIDGERKTVTALFADIKGSTELEADLDPEEARAIVDPALKLMIDAVQRYDGYVVQSTGDGIFAIFGAPVAHEDHPQRGLYAALRMQDELRRYSTRLVAEGGNPLQCRVGVNTGEVVVRSISTGGGHTEYTPIGHTTNLASRMQAVAPIGSIAVAEPTRKLCEGYFALKALGPTRVKGVTEPINVFEVTGLGPLRTRLQRAAGRGLTKFVGRDREVEAMRAASELARAGHGQIVAAMAEAGTGKSRLIFEFKAKHQAEWMVLETFPVSHGKASAFLPVLDLLNSYFKIASEDDARARRAKVTGNVLTLDQALKDTLPCLFALLGIVEGEDPFARMDANVRKQLTLDAVKRILLRESLNQPLIVIFEDLHWIDEQTQEFLNLLVDSIANAKILLLVNYRPEYVHQWGSRTYYTQLRLDPLGKESAEAMLSGLLGDSPDLAPLKRIIIERTEGNPFFMEETVQVLLEEGALVTEGSTCRLTRPLAGLKIPPTVQGILAARIDRLPAAAKDVLQTLSVIGRQFPMLVIRGVVAKADAELTRALGELQLGEFIYEQPAVGDSEFIFKHALTQEVTYQSVLLERRRLIHERIGAAIESLYGSSLDNHVAELAHHFSRSPDAERAVKYLTIAASRAHDRSAFEDAITRMREASALLKTMPRTEERGRLEFETQIRLSAALGTAHGFAAPETGEALEAARSMCAEFGNDRQRFLVLEGLRLYHRFRLELTSAHELTMQQVEIGQRINDPAMVAFSRGALATTLLWMGLFEEAESQFRLGMTQVDPAVPDPLFHDTPAGLYGQYAVNRSQHAWNLAILGFLDQAREIPDEVMSWTRRLTPVYPRTAGFLVSSPLGVFLRDPIMADERSREGVRLASQYGVSSIGSWGLAVQGWVLAQRGDLGRGIQTVSRALDDIRAGGGTAPDFLRFALVEMLLAQKNHQHCASAIQELIESGDRTSDRMMLAEVYRTKGALALAERADTRAAEEDFAKAIEIARGQRARLWELRATVSLALVLRDTNRRDEARGMLADIYNWFTEGFDTADLKDAKALLDELSG